MVKYLNLLYIKLVKLGEMFAITEVTMVQMVRKQLTKKVCKSNMKLFFILVKIVFILNIDVCTTDHTYRSNQL